MRRLFTAIHLVLITALAFQGVSLFYGATSLKIDRVQDVRPEAGDRDRPAIRTVHPSSYYRAIVERNVFNLAAIETAAPAEVAVENVEEIERTSLNLKLWGTVVGSDENSYAVIEDQRTRIQELYAIGDNIANTQAIVRRILNKTVILHINGIDEKLEMEDLARAAASSRPTPVRQMAPSAMAPQRVAEAASPQNIHIARSQIEDALGDINALMQQVNIRPHFEDGRPSGLMLSRIQPNSIFRRMGLRNGDVIVGVEGQPIESVDDALKFYENLRDSSDVSLEIRRGGQTRSIQYQIRD